MVVLRGTPVGFCDRGPSRILTRQKERGVLRILTSPTSRRFLTWAAVTLVVAGGVLLAVGSFLGLYVRPTSDDWCGAWKSRDMGLFGITEDFYDTQNGRVANAFLTGIVYSHGLLGPKILPALLVISLTVGLVLAVRSVWRMLGWRAPLLVVLAVALVLEMLLFFAGTRAYQVLLWAPATISHTLPGILGVWSVLGAIWVGRRRGRTGKWIAVALALLMGMTIATLSEPFTAVSGLFIGTAALLLLPRLRSLKDWYPFTWCVAWCLGLVVGFTVLYTSPGAQWRRKQFPPAHPPLSAPELKGAFHNWLQVWGSIWGQWAYLAAIAVGLLLGLATVDRTGGADERGAAGPDVAPRRPPWLTWVVLALPVPLMAIASFGVVFALRMGYGVTGWTYARTWTNFLFPMLLLLCMYGVLAGRALGRRLAAASAAPEPSAPASQRVTVGVVLIGAAACAFSLWAAAKLVPAVQTMAKATVTRSVAWDRQDARIRKEAAHGARHVAYGPLYIGNLAEPYFTRTYSRDWVASCVSHYYGVDSIAKPAAAKPAAAAPAAAGSPAQKKRTPAGTPAKRN